MRLGRGISVGRLFGIPLNLDRSWFIVSFLITWSFSDLFGEARLGLTSAAYWVMGVLAAALFFSSLVAHELSHALVAKRKGITVESITLFIFGGVAKIKNDPATAGDEFKIAAIGPLTSMVLGLLLWVMFMAADALRIHPAAVIFQTLAFVNVVLAIFNLLPGFPLDGGRILRSIVWRVTGDVVKATRIASFSGRAMAALLIAAGLYRVFFRQEFFAGAWWIFLGVFLNQAATSSYKALLRVKSMEGIEVGDVMTAEFRGIPGNHRLDAAVTDYFIARPHRAFPVLGYGNEVEGLVTLDQIQQRPQQQWPHLTVRQVLIPLDESIVTTPDEPVVSMLERLKVNPAGTFLVMDSGRLVGIVGPSDVAHYLHVKSAVSH